MEWQDWLEKTEPTGLTARQKKLAKEIVDDDNQDHKQQFTPTLDPKEASWETWLEKNDPCWEGYEQYGMKDKEGKKVPNCVKKNNATETSHKEGEKKEEWNGKFDNSTTRDDAKDEKAESEEESLEELTDGKLEEVEKLKAWEVFLHVYKTINQYPTDNRSEKKDEDGDTIVDYATGTQLQTSRETGEKTLTDDKHRDVENENTSNNLTELFGKKGQGRKNQDTGSGGKGRKGGDNRGGNIDASNMSYDTSEYNPNTGRHSVTLEGTRNEMRRINQKIRDESTKKPSSPKSVNPTQPPSKDDYARVDTEPVGIKNAAWELFLEKDSLDGKQSPNGLPNLAGEKYDKDPNPEEENVDKIMQNADAVGRKKNPMIRNIYRSWEGWLEKMQGAGDARYGNQHLTGMEQKPVADDESIDLSAESDKNNEKQEKTEDKEGKDNKPYKALSQE